MDMYAALAEPTRRNILVLLAQNGQLTATEISGNFSMTPPAISQHLKVLREAKLVDMEKRAQQRIYKINPVSIHQMEEWMRKLNELYEERYSRLDELLENQKKLIKK